LAAMLEKARRIAGRGDAPLSDRLAAVTTFGWDKSFYARDQMVLAGLLGPQTPDALQSAAVMAFGRMDDAAPAEMLTRSWRTYAPARQQQVLDVLLSRTAWQRHLLE